MKIDKTKSIPLYKQLQLILQDNILLGDWGPGYLLPTEQKLCDLYGISRITVRKALDDLVNLGFIDRIQGKGSIVKDRRIKASPTKVVQGFTSSTISAGKIPKIKILNKELIYGATDINKLLRVDENAPLWCFRRLCFVDDEPVVLMNNYVSKKMGDIMIEYDLTGKSFFSIYEKILKTPISSLQNIVTAVSASPEIAKLLEVEPNSAQVWFRGVAYIEGEIPVEVNKSIFKSSRYEFETTLFRPLEVDVCHI